jgi:hypothetical protein
VPRAETIVSPADDDFDRYEKWRREIQAGVELLGATRQQKIAAVVGLGRALRAAKEELDGSAFKRLTDDKSYKLGYHWAMRHIAIADHPILSNEKWWPYLPSARTTLYEMSKIASDVLVRAIETYRSNCESGDATALNEPELMLSIVHPDITAKQVQHLLPTVLERQEAEDRAKQEQAEVEQPDRPEDPAEWHSMSQKLISGRNKLVEDILGVAEKWLLKCPLEPTNNKVPLPEVPEKALRWAADQMQGWRVQRGQLTEVGIDFLKRRRDAIIAGEAEKRFNRFTDVGSGGRPLLDMAWLPRDPTPARLALAISNVIDGRMASFVEYNVLLAAQREQAPPVPEHECAWQPTGATRYRRIDGISCKAEVETCSICGKDQYVRPRCEGCDKPMSKSSKHRMCSKRCKGCGKLREKGGDHSGCNVQVMALLAQESGNGAQGEATPATNEPKVPASDDDEPAEHPHECDWIKASAGWWTCRVCSEPMPFWLAPELLSAGRIELS